MESHQWGYHGVLSRAAISRRLPHPASSKKLMMCLCFQNIEMIVDSLKHVYAFVLQNVELIVYDPINPELSDASFQLSSSSCAQAIESMKKNHSPLNHQ